MAQGVRADAIIPADVRYELDRIAGIRHVTRSKLIADILKEYIATRGAKPRGKKK